MIRIILGIILLLLYVGVIVDTIVKREPNLTGYIVGGFIVNVIPGALLIYFGLRSRRKKEGATLSKTRKHTITTKKQLVSTKTKKKPRRKSTRNLVFYRESKPGILGDKRIQLVKITSKSLKLKIKELESTKFSSQYARCIDSLIVGYDDNCYSGIIGIVSKLQSDSSTEWFSNWASQNLFNQLDPEKWDLEYRGETTLDGFRGDFSRSRKISLDREPEQYKKTDEYPAQVIKAVNRKARSVNKEKETRIRKHIESKIRFTPDTTASGIQNFNYKNKEHLGKVIGRIVNLADEVYGESGPSPASHRRLSDSWLVNYKTQTGNVSRKEYISPIEVLSPFGSSAIDEVEIIHAGSA